MSSSEHVLAGKASFTGYRACMTTAQDRQYLELDQLHATLSELERLYAKQREQLERDYPTIDPELMKDDSGHPLLLSSYVAIAQLRAAIAQYRIAIGVRS